MIKKALITGGCGFIGSNLTKVLVDKGWDLSLVIRKNTNLKPLSSISSKVKFLVHDGSMERMDSIVGESTPDVVFHLSTFFLSEHGPADLENLIQSNTN